MNTSTPPPASDDALSFEAAFARLAEILERISSDTIPLEESLKLYEEADRLVAFCTKQLNEAERKLYILAKNRTGELILGNEGRPVMEEFSPPPPSH